MILIYCVKAQVPCRKKKLYMLLARRFLEKKIIKLKTLMPLQKNAGQNCNVNTTNMLSKMANFKYLGTTLTNKNWMHEEISENKVQIMAVIMRCKIGRRQNEDVPEQDAEDDTGNRM
jgi:hypothetical protein